jgi:protein involved in polysaccharide export with SLBB domain
MAGRTAPLKPAVMPNRSRSFFVVGGTLLALALTCFGTVAFGQAQRAVPLASSDLGRDNFSRVGASLADLKTLLLKEPGLLVELKRWVAKDATDHGQIISDSDLTDDAIFERMQADSQFRAIATALVQKYGYLLPRSNPDSESAREHELLMQERIKWLAQQQEEALASARQRTSENLQNARACDPQFALDCENSQSNPGPGPDSSQRPPRGPSPGTVFPEPSNPPNLPAGNANPQERARIMQTSGEPLNNAPLSQISGRSEAEQNFNALDENVDWGTSRSSLQQLLTNGEDQPGWPELNDWLAGEPNASDAGAGNGPVSDLARNSGYEWGQTANNRRTDWSVPSGLSAVIPVAAPARRYQRDALLQPVEMVRKQNPYTNIPSLYDMYLQAVPRPATPRRFGSEVFENGTRDPQLIPMDLPAGPDYVLGPGDGLSIDLWGGVSQRVFRTVDREGRISLPEAGPVLVSGKSLGEVQQDLQQIMRNVFRDESAEVSLARLRMIRIYEVGEVANPGAYDISSLSTPLNALFAAGGPTAKGSLRMVKHYRGDQLVQVVDHYDLLLRGVKSGMARLDNGDTVLVPPMGAQVTVEGMVRRPAIYELKDEKNLAAVLELAGGLLPTAALGHIEVQRLVAHDKQTMLSLDIPKIDNAAEVTAKLASFEIQDGDRIRIFPIASYNHDAIYLDGHVIRPGRYSYRANMRVTDVIASYKDLLPEPATKYAEIIRLDAIDFHPTVESFDLAVAFADPAQSPVLHAMDTVRVLSRFDFENPPSVSVWGDVRAPGTYRTSGQIRLGDAVRLAGGLGPDAKTDDAQIFRYLPDGKFKIFSVDLNEALDGDPTQNILLVTRDRLLIHRNPDAAEPATVYLQGEAMRPGRYPLSTNMTVAELIRVGGGLKPSADTKTVDLTHFQYAGQTMLTAQHEVLSIPAAFTNTAEGAATAQPDVATNPVALHNGDVLAIRQLPGWNDLGASIRVKGEVKNPGTYGIRPGEKLSSILERAGGFQAAAYPYGAILRRAQVRELQAQNQNEMFLRVRDEQSNLQLLPETDATKKGEGLGNAAVANRTGKLEFQSSFRTRGYTNFVKHSAMEEHKRRCGGAGWRFNRNSQPAELRDDYRAGL